MPLAPALAAVAPAFLVFAAALGAPAPASLAAPPTVAAAPTIARRVRAFNPAPGAAGVLGGETVKVWAAHPEAGRTEAGDGGDAGEVVAVDSDGNRSALTLSPPA